MLKDSILETTPVPYHHLLTPARLDQDIVDLIPGNIQKPVSLTDASFVKVQTKIGQVMAPLGKLWSTLESAAIDGHDSVDLKRVLELV